MLPSPDVILPATGGCGTCGGAMGCGFSGSCSLGFQVALDLSVPCDPSLVGGTAFAQVARVFLGSSPGVRLSNALAVTFS